MQDSIFTKMVKGELTVPFLYEDARTFAILDNNPVSRGHALVITKEQIDKLELCSEELYTAIFKTVRKLSRHLKEKLNPQRVAIVVHGTEVSHVHVHLVPLYTGKELHLADRPQSQPKKQAEIAVLSKELRL